MLYSNSLSDFLWQSGFCGYSSWCRGMFCSVVFSDHTYLPLWGRSAASTRLLFIISLCCENIKHIFSLFLYAMRRRVNGNNSLKQYSEEVLLSSLA